MNKTMHHTLSRADKIDRAVHLFILTFLAGLILGSGVMAIHLVVLVQRYTKDINEVIVTYRYFFGALGATSLFTAAFLLVRREAREPNE